MYLIEQIFEDFILSIIEVKKAKIKALPSHGYGSWLHLTRSLTSSNQLHVQLSYLY